MKINYDTRVDFYLYEVEEDKNIVSFLNRITNELGIHSAINCPCANGMYIDYFSSLFLISCFIDVSDAMIKDLNRIILNKRLKNVITKQLNMLDIGDLSSFYDCIFFLNQGVQYLNLIEFEYLINSCNSKFVILDLFNFKKPGNLTYFNYNKNNCFYYSKTFKYLGKKIYRYNKHYGNEAIKFEYKYKTSNNKLLYETEYILYNYVYEDIIKLLKNTKYKILKCYGDYDFSYYKNITGHYILVLKRSNYEF